METRGATPSRVIAMTLFALSCVGLLLFLWVSFGGTLPFRSEGYRFSVLLPESGTVQNQGDVRIAGVSVGKVVGTALDGRYTRVTIESDQPLQNSQQLLQGPDRLVVDLNGLDLDQELKDLVSKITPNDPQIQSVRIGQYQPHVVRMVFDLKGSVKPQVFTLTPIGPRSPCTGRISDSMARTSRRFSSAAPPAARPISRSMSFG